MPERRERWSLDDDNGGRDLELRLDSTPRERSLSLSRRRMCEWCGRFDCETFKRHSDLVAEAKAASTRASEATIVREVQEEEPSVAAHAPLMRRAASATATAPNRQSRAWHFVNSGGISWTNSIRRHRRSTGSPP